MGIDREKDYGGMSVAKKWMPYFWQIPLAEGEIPMDKGGFRTVMKPDREKVIKGLEICSDCGFCESIKKFDLRCPYRNNDGKGCDRSQLLMDALALLKEQEHKDKMFHALEDDWKRLNELLKEQETDIGNLNETVKNLLNAYTEIKAIYGGQKDE